VANTTKYSSGGTTKTLTGVPTSIVATPASPQTLIYVDGTVTGLTGPGQGQPAIQDNVMITIAGAGDIDITGDVIYKTEPVTIDNADALIPAAAGMNQVLGVFTSTGNINLYSPYGNNNLEVDGSLAAIGSSCASNSCGFLNLYNSYINTFNNVGGQIQSNIFAANMSVQNTYFDRRFTSRSGFAPPWFPSTVLSSTAPQGPPVLTPTQQRTSWSWLPSQ
jgi:hypothetical protein